MWGVLVSYRFFRSAKPSPTGQCCQLKEMLSSRAQRRCIVGNAALSVPSAEGGKTHCIRLKLTALPTGVVLRAANLVIAMIAGGNHTLIPRWQKSALRNRFLTDEGCYHFVPVLSERAEKLRPHIRPRYARPPSPKGKALGKRIATSLSLLAMTPRWGGVTPSPSEEGFRNDA